MIRIRSSLSSKLSLSIILLSVPIFMIALGLFFVKSRNYIRKEAMEQVSSMLNITMQRVCQHLKTVETATDVNEWLAVHYLQPDSLLALTRHIVQYNSHIDGCSISTDPYVFPKYGRYFSAYTVREPDSIVTVVEEKYEYFEKVWYKTPKALGKPCWVVYFDESDSLEVTLDGLVSSYSKPLYDADDRFVGVISTDLALLHLSKIISEEKPYPHSYFMMVGSDGQYFIHPDTAMLFKKTIFSDVDPRSQSDLIALGHEMTAGSQGIMPVVIDGVDCHVCYQPVPDTPWSLALVCPDSDVLHDYHQLTYIVAFLYFVGLIVILILCQRAVAHAIKPINLLLKQTKSIADGNYEVYIAHSQRIDAVGRLQNSFATMLESLNFHMGSVRYSAEQAERRNEELARATRLAEEADRQKTVFIQNVSHQIRTPLNIIMGFTQILRDNAAILPEEELKVMTDSLKHNTMLLLRMVQMLFDCSETGMSEELSDSKCLEKIRCNEYAREAVDFVGSFYPQIHIGVETTVPDEFCVKTNSSFFLKTLRELVFNAVKYSDGEHIIVRVEQTDTAVRFVVEDTGSGIPEEDHDRMFEPFTKLNDLSEGLGLGLPLCKQHVDNLGGKLTLDADYHDGCRFIVELPKDNA